MKRYAIRVTGKVQGVFFRQSTQQEANRLGLAGFVRNEPDRSVYLEAEGAEAALQALIRWCHTGPPLARVEEVIVNPQNPQGEALPFRAQF
ncbi:MAG: acylphosphatase [Bacteroidetes bacterium]|nr:MAG: acylphosphatase [Bacteroidota bacterium]